MTINRTTLLDLPLPVTGTESGTWGDTTNNGLTQYMDIAIAGMSNLTSANFTAGAVTIETTEGTSSATNIVATSAQYAGFRVTSLAQNSTITVGNTGTSPARSYRLINADATYSLTFKATGQTGVTLLPGQSAVVAFNGTDYVIVGMVGAGTATDNAVVRFDGTTGKLVQNSVVTIADSTGDVAGVGALTMGGNLTLGGNLVVNGNTTLGDAAADNLTVNATITSNMIFTDNTYDIGASGATRPRNLYVGTNSYISGKELIGSVTTTNNLRVAESFAVVSTASNSSGASFTGYSGTGAGYRPLLDFQRSRGTTDGNLTAVVSGDSIGSLIFRGADGSSFVDGAGILALVDSSVSTGAVPIALTFATGANGTITNRYTISSGGVHTWSGSSVSPTISAQGYMGLGGNTGPSASLALGSVNNGTGEATYKGAIQIQNTGGGNALYAGGLEFKSASASGGYGWSIAAPDLLSGDTPLVFTQRRSSANWSEIARFSGTSTPGLIVGGTSAVGGARITAQSNQSGTSFLTNSAIYTAYNPTPGTEVPGLYMFDGTDTTLLTQVAGTFGISQNGVVRAFFTRSGGKTLFGLGASSASQDIYVTTSSTTSMSLDTSATNTYTSYRLNNGNSGGATSGVALHYFGSTYPTSSWAVASSMGLSCWGSGGMHIAQLDSGNAGKINFWTGGSGSGVLRAAIPNNASGIEFPASPVLSSNVNTLDTYEEGTYNGTITSDGTQPTVTYSYRACKYTRVGNFVMVRLAMDFNVTVAGSGQLYVSLPFTSANLANFYQHWLSGYYNNTLAESIVAGGVTWASTVSILYTSVNAGATDAATTGQRSFQATIYYFTEST